MMQSVHNRFFAGAHMVLLSVALAPLSRIQSYRPGRFGPCIIGVMFFSRLDSRNPLVELGNKSLGEVWRQLATIAIRYSGPAPCFLGVLALFGTRPSTPRWFVFLVW